MFYNIISLFCSIVVKLKLFKFKQNHKKTNLWNIITIYLLSNNVFLVTSNGPHVGVIELIEHENAFPSGSDADMT
jgi:hypothetical protein